MKSRVPPLLILGVFLIVLGLCIMFMVQLQLSHGEKNCRETVAEMGRILPARTPGIRSASSDPCMPVLELRGTDYVALLEIPSFGITLPVADSWDKAKLTHSPVRFCGSAYDNSLVIGGADHPTQFGFCAEIQHGTAISVTDMAGAQFSYTVSRIDRAKHAETSWLQSGEYDLSLFCRDTYSLEYIVVRCISANT